MPSVARKRSRSRSPIAGATEHSARRTSQDAPRFRERRDEPHSSPTARAELSSDVGHGNVPVSVSHGPRPDETEPSINAPQPVPPPSPPWRIHTQAFLTAVSSLTAHCDSWTQDLVSKYPRLAGQTSRLTSGFKRVIEDVLNPSPTTTRSKSYKEAATTSPGVSGRPTNPSETKKQATHSHIPQRDKKDPRIMVRLPQDHPARQHHPCVIREKVNDNVKGDRPVRDVHAVPSGITLVTKSG